MSRKCEWLAHVSVRCRESWVHHGSIHNLTTANDMNAECNTTMD